MIQPMDIMDRLPVHDVRKARAVLLLLPGVFFQSCTQADRAEIRPAHGAVFTMVMYMLLARIIRRRLF